jgi:hypothetical protein
MTLYQMRRLYNIEWEEFKFIFDLINVSTAVNNKGGWANFTRHQLNEAV